MNVKSISRSLLQSSYFSFETQCAATNIQMFRYSRIKQGPIKQGPIKQGTIAILKIKKSAVVSLFALYRVFINVPPHDMLSHTKQWMNVASSLLSTVSITRML